MFGLKVVLLHDWLTGFRGGERVLEVFCEMFPDAPLYTLIHKKESVPKIIENRKIVTSFLNKIPYIHKHYRKFLPLFPMAVDLMPKIEDADLILSSSHCVIKGVHKKDGIQHLSYIHSPMRYLYDQYDNYFGPDAPFYQRLGMFFCRRFLKKWDQASNRNVDQFVANSSFVQKRVKHYYGVDSKVIHPFVDLEDFRDCQNFPPKKEDFYIMVTAFAPNKRVDLAILAFNKLGYKLKIIGSGQQENELKNLAADNIEFLGNLGRKEVISHFAKAQAMIFPGVEDFGITPLESMASGTPVIAYKAGGVLETLNDRVAIFFSEATVDALCKAVNQFDSKNFPREVLYMEAEKFSKENFRHKIEAEMIKLLLEKEITAK